MVIFEGCEDREKLEVVGLSENHINHRSDGAPMDYSIYFIMTILNYTLFYHVF